MWADLREQDQHLHPFHHEKTQQERGVYEPDKHAVPGMEPAVAQGFLDPRTMRNTSLCLYTTPFMTFCYND